MDYYGANALVAVAGVLAIIALIIIASGLLLYILHSIGIMTLAKRRGLSIPWLVWIPIVGSFTVGAIADDIAEKQGEKGIFRYLMLGGSILGFVMSGAGNLSLLFNAVFNPYAIDSLYASGGFGVLGGLISLAFYVIHIVVLNRIFKFYRPHSATTWTVLCIFFPFMQSIFPFVIRNSESPTANSSYDGGNFPSQQSTHNGQY